MYLYILEDGYMRQSSDPPTDQEKINITEGYLTGVRKIFETFIEMDGDVIWVRIDKGTK